MGVMSKDWEYAALGENERLELISKGNDAVYNSEKKRNASLKSLKSSLGLSTKNEDTWDSVIEAAWSKSTTPKGLSDAEFDVLTGSPTTRATYLLNSEMDIQRQRTGKEMRDIAESVEDELENLAEWLANNGYSVKGNTANKSKEEIKKKLSEAFGLLQAEHKHRLAEILAGAIS